MLVDWTSETTDTTHIWTFTGTRVDCAYDRVKNKAGSWHQLFAWNEKQRKHRSYHQENCTTGNMTKKFAQGWQICHIWRDISSAYMSIYSIGRSLLTWPSIFYLCRLHFCNTAGHMNHLNTPVPTLMMDKFQVQGLKVCQDTTGWLGIPVAMDVQQFEIPTYYT